MFAAGVERRWSKRGARPKKCLLTSNDMDRVETLVAVGGESLVLSFAVKL